MLSPKQNARMLMAAGGQPEYIAFHDNIWKDTLARWVKEGYPTDGNGNPMPPAKHFGYDLLLVGGIDPMPFRGAVTVVEETSEWIVTRNGAGATFRFWKEQSGAPEHLGFDLSSREIWNATYRPLLVEADERRVDTASIKDAIQFASHQNLFLCYHEPFLWENMRAMLGDEIMLQSMALDPDWIQDYNRVYTDFYKAHYQMVFEKFGLPDGISLSEDLAYNKGLLCSPGMLRELFLPFFKEIVAFAHSYGLSVTVHSDGDIREAIPLFIEAGMDGINPMEAKANCRALECAEEYADVLAFKGGLDVRILESNDPALISRETKKLLEGMKRLNARYIFGSDHSVSARVSYDSFQCAMDTYRENKYY